MKRFLDTFLILLMLSSLVLNVVLFNEYQWALNKAAEAQRAHEATLKDYDKFLDEVQANMKVRKDLRDLETKIERTR